MELFFTSYYKCYEKDDLMNKRNLFFIGLLAIGCFAAKSLYAGDDIELTKSVVATGLIKIDNVRGEVSIIGWDKDEISIAGELDTLAKGLMFEIDGDHAVIKVEMPNGSINWGDGSDLTIRVPKGSRVDFVGISTDVFAEDISGGIRINSVSGDIKTNNLQGHLMLSSVSGQIVIKHSEGQLRCASVSGDVEVLSHMGKINLDTVSGNVDIKVVENEKLRVKSISGDIDVMSDLLSGGFIDLESISGEIKLALQGEFGAEFDIDAGMSGDIENDLTDDQVSRTSSGQQKLKMKFGDGSGEIRIRTMSADIRIE
jgi:hypothetical protein